MRKKIDFLNSESDEDEDVSDVDPEELQKMLEGLDFSDSEDRLSGKSNSKKTEADIPKTSNLKSSIKTTGNNGAENQRKVQFSKDTKDQEFDFDQDGGIESYNGLSFAHLMHYVEKQGH